MRWAFWLNLVCAYALASERCTILIAHAGTTLSVAIESPHALQLAGTPGGLPAQNTYFSDQATLLDPLADPRWAILHEGPQAQHQLDQQLREWFGQGANVFPDSTNTTLSAPEIHGAPLFIQAQKYRELVQSTEPTLRAFRALLQEFLSGQPQPSSPAIPESVKNELFLRMSESIYHEPLLHHPSLIDYPFLGVVGFDAALADLGAPQPIFYELNAGTPSGMGNNVQLTELLFQARPQWAQAWESLLTADDSFHQLKSVIDANALAWTGNPHGISVIVSPGPYNAFHPDVVHLAIRSGLSLVRPEDLYEDWTGAIRLNTGGTTSDPIVTGIYSRMEESYLLANLDAGIAARGPHSDRLNRRFASKQSVTLQPGVLYKYLYDSKGRATGLDLSTGRPQLQEIFGSSSANLLRAVHARKLYISNLGGRLIDDKRLFNTVARQLAPLFADSPTSPIAGPPPTLSVAQVKSLLANTSPDFSKLVVKEAEGSGGSGVYFAGRLSAQGREDLYRRMRANPEGFVVQELVHSLVHLSAAPGQHWTTRAFDCRVFVFFDAAGKARAGPQSLLLRVAGAGEGRSNTSSGGGYGIGLVLDSSTSPRTAPTRPAPRTAPLGRRQQHAAYLADWEKLLSSKERIEEKELERLTTEHLAILDLLGLPSLPLLHSLRANSKGDLSEDELRIQALAFLSLVGS